MSETLTVKPKIISLNSESNDIYMLLTMCILTDKVNLNNARFTEGYIDGVVENKETYIGIPLCVNKTKLENGVYNTLGHEFDPNSGELKTEVIGAFSDFWKEADTEGILQLMGTVKIYKRFPSVCEALLELYDAGDLEFSCESLVYGYESIEGKTRNIAYSYEGQTNVLIGSAVVSNPAEIRSNARTVVAEALEKDLALEGGEVVSENNKPETLVFNKGNKIKFHGTLESASLKFSDVADQIYNILNPIDPKSGYRDHEFWVSDLYLDYVIVEDWDDCDTLWRVGYQVINDTVVLDSSDKWVKGTKGFIPDGVNVDSLIDDNKNAALEMESKINDVLAAKEEVVKGMEEQVKELQEKIDALTAQVGQLDQLVVSQQEKIVEHENKEKELSEAVEALTPFKEQVETAEKQAKKDSLIDKFSQLLSDEVMKSEAVINAVESLDENTLNKIVVTEVAKEVATKNETKEKHVIVSARSTEDLVPQSLKDRLYSAKSE